MKSWEIWQWEKPGVLGNKLLFPFAWVVGMVSHRHSCKGIFTPWFKTLFNPEWMKDLRFINSNFHVFCILCHFYVDVSGHGKGTIDKYASAEKHRSNRQTIGASPLKTFFGEATLPQNEKNLYCQWGGVWKNKIHSENVPAPLSVQTRGLHKRKRSEYFGGDQCFW